MKKRIITTVSVLTLILMATGAFAYQHGFGKNGMGNCPRFDRQALADLSQEQRDQLQELRQKFIDETYETRNAMMLKRNGMRMLMETSNPDRSKLNAMLEEINELRGELMTKRMDFILQAKKIAPELTMGMDGNGFGRGKGQGRGCRKMMNQNNQNI